MHGISDFQVPGRNQESDSAARRLRQAVRLAGGNRTVAGLSGVPLGTLNSYLAGGTMKVPALVALADACGVSVEWLATGRGETLSETKRQQLDARPLTTTEEAAPKAEPRALFALVDMALMGNAIEMATEALKRRGVKSVDNRRLAQIICLIYDTLSDDLLNSSSRDSSVKTTSNELDRILFKEQ